MLAYKIIYKQFNYKYYSVKSKMLKVLKNYCLSLFCI